MLWSNVATALTLGATSSDSAKESVKPIAREIAGVKRSKILKGESDF
jgi:hypothetical protein